MSKMSIPAIWETWQKNKIQEKAAALTYYTLLLLVPVIGIMLIAYKLSWGATMPVIENILGYLLPYTLEEIRQVLQSTVQTLASSSFGIIGLIASVILTNLLFNHVEDVFNEINKQEPNAIVNRTIRNILIIMVIIPALFGIYFGVIVYLPWILSYLIANAIVGIIIGYAYHRFAKNIQTKDCIIAGLAIMPALFVIKKLFDIYLTYFIQYEQTIYGELAIILAFLFWIWLIWQLILTTFLIVKQIGHKV